MKHLIKTALFGIVLTCVPTVSRADTVQLKTGAVLVGDVELAEGGEILITTRFPEKATFTLKREDLVPRSLYDVLDRRTDPKDADKRLQLGELAESAGLYGLAVSDYLIVAELRPELLAEMKQRIERVRESIAAGLLEDARQLMEDGNPRGALMYLHTIQERYGSTKAAKEAKSLLATTHAHAGAATDVAEKTVSEEKAPKVIKSLQKNLDKGHREADKLKGHEGDSSRDAKTADKAIRYFESAWKEIKTLPVTASDGELQATIKRLRKLGKERLVQAYLTAGSIHLQRYSIPRAEEYCNKACELAPDEKSTHALHRLIIEAKIYGSNGWIGR